MIWAEEAVGAEPQAWAWDKPLPEAAWKNWRRDERGTWGREGPKMAATESHELVGGAKIIRRARPGDTLGVDDFARARATIAGLRARVEPDMLIVPPELEMTASRLMAETADLLADKPDAEVTPELLAAINTGYQQIFEAGLRRTPPIWGQLYGGARSAGKAVTLELEQRHEQIQATMDEFSGAMSSMMLAFEQPKMHVFRDGQLLQDEDWFLEEATERPGVMRIRFVDDRSTGLIEVEPRLPEPIGRSRLRAGGGRIWRESGY